MSCATKTCKRCGEVKPAESFYAGSVKCKPCDNIASREHYAKNKDRIRARQSERSKVKRDQDLVNKAAYYAKNRAALIEKSKRYHEANRELRARYKLDWQRANKQRVAEYAANRRAVKLNSAVKWSDGFIVSEMYDLARRRTMATGIEWHVDHIVPLQSERVCGLHAHTNLRVIPGLENKVKGNSVWPGMPQ